MYRLIVTAKMNDIDPQSLARRRSRSHRRAARPKIDKLLLWKWRQLNVRDRQAA
jgi:hypothetical protein